MIFLNPAALAGLIALPILWVILRFIPPAPKKIYLPSARFLKGLQSEDAAPQSTPWWLRLLRLMILSFLILAFAGPVLHPEKPSDETGPMRLVFDNNWASAQSWDLQMAKAEALLSQAQKNDRVVQFMPTASSIETNAFTTADEALKKLKSLKPMPFPAALENIKISGDAETHWVTSGIADPGFDDMASRFMALGGLTVYVPDMNNRAGLLRGPSADMEKSIARIEIPSGAPERNVNLQAFNDKGIQINQMRQTITGQVDGIDILDETDLFKGKAIARWSVTDFRGAGGLYWEDSSRGTGLIGIPLQAGNNSQTGFEDASFYLTRAAAPFATVVTGSIAALIEQQCGVIVLPDIVSFATDDLDRLEAWVKRGGVLLRFGGPSMSESDNVLIPVALKTGMRSLSGDISWGTPLKLAAFPATSPFAGTTPPDVTVERQLLAAPSADLAGNTWAQLTDGTPVITARTMEKGLTVLVHTTATPQWSDFVLSGFYVSFLKEIVELAALPDKSVASDKNLQPFMLLDGYGQLQKPENDSKPLTRQELETTIPSKDHPPGLYSDGNRKFAFNLGDHLPALNPVGTLPQGARSLSLLPDGQERNLSPLFFLLAMLLFLIDWIILIASSKIWRRSVAVFILLTIPFPALAQPNADNDVTRAASIHLACVQNDQADLCRQALSNVAQAVTARTSSTLGDTVIVDLEKDDLSFYPLLYWPLSPSDNLSQAARTNLQSYIYKGGMILIDTQDGPYDGNQIVQSQAVLKLRAILEGFSIPLLKPAPHDFVLFKSFYLLNIHPEYDLTGKIWVEEDSISPAQGISSVMVTGEDWMRKWAYPSSQTDAEMASRFGVNLAIYALTGNYKADQVHMKAILERMGN